jgi:hypothetical protein
MTLPAVDSWDVRGVDGPAYRVGPHCSMPTCERWAEHAHHIVRRSAIGGGFDWVEIDGVLYANKTGLCPAHHDDITGRIGGHKAAIRLLTETHVESGVHTHPLDDLAAATTSRTFYWCSIEQTPEGKVIYLPYAPLDPQPPSPDSLAQRAPTESDSEPCPFCGQSNRRRRGTTAPSGPRRRRKTWCIQVPDDHEDGAQVLDTLVDDVAPIMGIEPSRTGRYFVAAAALFFVQQNLKEFAASWKGH